MKIWTKILCAALAVAFAVSCTDEAYVITDDSQLDSSMSLFGDDFSLPVGDSKEMHLEELIKLEQGSTLVVDADGNYKIEFRSDHYTGSSTLESVKFPGLSIKPSKFFQFTFPQEIVGTEFPFPDITEEVNAQSTVNVESEIPSYVTEVEYIALKEDINVNFAINTGKITLKKGFRIILPDRFVISSAESFIKVSGGNVAEFTSDVTVTPSKLKFVLTLEKYCPRKEDIKDGKIKISEPVDFQGTVFVTSQGFGVIPSKLEVSADFTAAAGNVDEAKAKVKYVESIDKVYQCNIPALPSGIKNVNLDLTDPVVTLFVRNQSPFYVIFEGTLTPVKNGVQGKDLSISDVKVAPNAETKVCLCKSTHQVGPEDVKIVVDNFSEFFGNYPEQILMRGISYSTDDSQFVIIKQGMTFSYDMNVNFDTLLSFGAGSSIDMETTIEKLGIKLDDQGVSITKFSLSFSAYNTIPLTMTLNATLLDSKGQEIPDVTVTTKGVIEAGSLSSPTASPIAITVESEGQPIAIEGMRLMIKGEVLDGQYANIPVNKEQYVKFNDIILKVIDGINVKPEK